MLTVVAGYWFTSIYLKDLYFHVAIKPPHRKFRVSGPPFGLSLSSHTFTKVVEAGLASNAVSGAHNIGLHGRLACGSGVEGAGTVSQIHAGFPCSVSRFHNESREELFDFISAHSISESRVRLS